MQRFAMLFGLSEWFVRSHQVWEFVCSSLGRVKLMTIQFVFVAHSP